MKAKVDFQKTDSSASLQNLVTFCDLSIRYPQSTAVQALSGSFQKGSMTAIVGPNGGGKTTLLKVLSGAMRHGEGTLDFQNLAPHEIAYLPQHPQIDRMFPISVGDIVSMGLCPDVGFYRRMEKNTRGRILEALQDVGLENKMDAPLHTLSGGQFQRVLFARMSLQKARLILLDEPFSAIDTDTTTVLLKLLKRWHQDGKTIIAVLHDLDLVRAVFPQTLLLSKTPVAWGETKVILTHENLKKAKSCWTASTAELSCVGDFSPISA